MSSADKGSRIRRDASSRMPLEVPEVPDELAEILKSELERPSRYVELCTRSNFSFLRGGSSPEALVRKARALGYDTLALTDVNGLYGVVRAWEEAKRVGMKLIVGCELTVEFPSPAPESGAPVVLLVRTLEGYVNLCQLLTLGHARKPKGECLVLMNELCTYSAGLELLLLDPYTCPKILREAYRGHIHLALWFHKDGEDRARLERAFHVERTEQVPIVATNRVLFAQASDKALLDVMTCIREKKTLDEAGLLLVPNTEPALKSESAIEKLFANHPEWTARSRRIADQCTFSLSELRYDFPSDEENETPDAKLRRLTYEGAHDRYASGIPPKVELQIEKELAVIQKLGVAPYFLSIQEIVNMARAKDILCQGRGSAANSAVCYCLRVTAVDPARSNLLFERFLSEERKEPPDIDVDFEHERREEVIQAIYDRYGRKSAAMVSEVICYRGKSALREVGKVFGFSLDQLDGLASLVSFWDGASSLRAKDLEACGFDATDGRVQQVCRLAQAIEGFPRHLSIHVGGFVLSAKPLVNVAPIEPAAMEKRTVIPWDKDDIDALGFFKVDVLGLGMLTALRKALDLVAQSQDTKASGSRSWNGLSAIDRLAAIPAEDPAVYDALSRADTVGVFQIESRAQMAMLPRLKPKEFYDLVVEVAIVRPGPIQGGMVHPYLRRRTGEEPIDYPHSCLKGILERTLGVPLFQEQVMQIAIVGAGYSGGEADQLRRDMAAWRRNGRLESHQSRLDAGFRKRGISKAFSERLFAQIRGFGEYGFPESHAASFALLVYASAWIKVHHPAAFAASLINSQPMGFYSPSTILEDAGRHGVEVEPICIEKSTWDVTLGADRKLRLGFRLIKGFSEDAARRIVDARTERVFASLTDLTHRAALSKAEIHMLAESGALQPLVGGSRRNAIWQARAPREKDGLFAGCELESEAGRRPPEASSETSDASMFAPLSATEQLSLDYARTGVSVGTHPMRIARESLPRNILTSSQLFNVKKGKKVQVAGMVICRQRPMTASGVVFMTLEDEFGFINLVLWQRTFQQFRRLATTESMIVVTGKVDRSDSGDADTQGKTEDGPLPVHAGTIHVIVSDIAPLRLRSKGKRPGGALHRAGEGSTSATSHEALPSMSRDFH